MRKLLDFDKSFRQDQLSDNVNKLRLMKNQGKGERNGCVKEVKDRYS